jgi:hypothetical protein
LLPPRRAALLIALAGLLLLLTTTLPALGEDGVIVTFTSGTGDTGGNLTVTSASTGSTSTSSIPPHWSPSACANTLGLAAPKIGFRVEVSGNSVRIFGRGAIVRVAGATITKTDLAGGP